MILLHYTYSCCRTLWYELLSGEWPFKHLHNTPESVIWMVGRGMKPPLVSINSNKDVKVRVLSFILITACVAQLANASDTQAVGRGFEP